jgi:hypothetical protein
VIRERRPDDAGILPNRGRCDVDQQCEPRQQRRDSPWERGGDRRIPGAEFGGWARLAPRLTSPPGIAAAIGDFGGEKHFGFEMLVQSETTACGLSCQDVRHFPAGHCFDATQFPFRVATPIGIPKSIVHCAVPAMDVPVTAPEK